MRLIVSYFHLPALCPFLGSHSRYSHASAKFKYSFSFELRTVIDNIACQYDSCFPKSEAIEAVREGFETGDVESHAVGVVDDDFLVFDLEDHLTRGFAAALLIVAHCD